MQKNKIITAILLCALLLTAVLSSCDAENQSETLSGEETTSAENSGGESETTVPEVNWESAGVPQTDFDGYEFTFLSAEQSNDHAWYKLDAAEEIGEPLNDAIYLRNKKIEEVFNISIEEIHTGGYQAAMQKAVNAGDVVYDAGFGTLQNQFVLGQSGYLINLYKLPHINLDQPWWDESITRCLTYDGRLYVQAGDITPIVNIRTLVMVFNKDMCKALGYDSPYDYVLDGKWTLDVFAKYVKGVNADLNGDGVMDYEDQWGFFSENGNSFMTYFAAGGTITERSEDGTLKINFDSARNIDIMTKALEITIDPDVTLMANPYVSDNGNSWSAASAWYASGHALMRSSVFEPVPRDYRDMETDFGVLPYPKFSEEQEKYRSFTQVVSAYAISVPKSNADPDRTGLLLEAMAAQSTDSVKKAFYDVCLNGKYVRDDESKVTIDMIFGNKFFDIGNVLDFGGFTAKINGLETKKSLDVASTLTAITSSAQTALDKYIVAYAALEE